MSVRKNNGFSFYFTYGQNGGFRIENGKNIKRLVLWKIAFGILNKDMEQFFEEAFLLADRYKAKIAAENE